MGHNTSSASIFVQWGKVLSADQTGIILSYTVTYEALPDGSPQTKVVSVSTTQVTLTGLNEYTNYSITVFASTVKGDGNISVPIFVITDEDSKLLTLLRPGFFGGSSTTESLLRNSENIKAMRTTLGG